VEPIAVVAAAVAMMPAFAYLPLVHLAFRDGDERAVLGVNIAGIIVAGGLAWVLIPPLGLTGAMTAAAVGQVSILALHLLRTRWRHRHPSAHERPLAHALSDV
jgi:O-antigen/teichoic acid export membrane protein